MSLRETKNPHRRTWACPPAERSPRGSPHAFQASHDVSLVLPPPRRRTQVNGQSALPGVRGSLGGVVSLSPKRRQGCRGGCLPEPSLGDQLSGRAEERLFLAIRSDKLTLGK